MVKRQKSTKRRNLNLILLLLTGCWLTSTVQAQQVEAEGTAPISGLVGNAKRMAMQDAIRQALIQVNAQVSTTTVLSSRGVVSDNMRFTAKGSVTNVVLLDEWTDKSNYYVRIRAEVPSGGRSVPVQARPRLASMGMSESRDTVNITSSGITRSAAQRRPAQYTQFSGQDAATGYRRNMAITQFHVIDRSQITDLPNIEVEMARELKRRMDADSRVRTVDASQYLVPLGDEGLMSQRRILGALPPAKDSEQIAIEFAESLGVQFVVTGVIRDMGTTKHMLGSRIRHLELDLVVHDGITGAQIARHRVNESVEESNFSKFQSSVPAMNDKFYASAFGRKVNQVLDKLVNMLAGDLSTQPFTARVIRAEGNKIFFDAGGLANIRVGDVLTTYQLSQASVNDLPGQRTLGFQEKATNTLVVTQVQRLFSVGELATETARLSPGDVIRFEP